jgi:4-amino-4-deoxy-L-arabinose transferase-like glycosyltransferase
VWRAPALLLLLCSLTFLAGLGGPAIADSDEAFYAETAREMLDRGDWITPYFNDETRFQKPILSYWLIAATYKVVGVNEFAARCWSALSGVGIVLVTWAAGRRWYGDGVGLVAGAIIATCYGAFNMARQALPDLPLTFFMTLATWALIEAVQITRPLPGGGAARADQPDASRGRWLLIASAAMAFGLLTKGPVAIVLPVATVALLIVLERRQHPDARRLPLSASDVALAGGVFLLVAAPWFLAVTLVHGVEYLFRFFVGENLERFATARYNEPRPIYFFVPVILGGLLPWTPFVLLWVKPLWRVLRRQRRLSAAEIRIALWALVPFAFYSASVGKQPRYVLPCLAPLAILLGASLWRYLGADHRGRWAWRTLGFLTSGTMIFVGAAILRARPMFAAADPAWSPTGPYVIIACGAAAAVAALALAPRIGLGVLTGAAAATLLGLQASVFSPARPEPVEVIGAAVRAQGPEPTVCTCGAFTRNLVFYARHFTLWGETDEAARRILEQMNHTIVVVDAEMLNRIEAASGRRYVRLAEVTYLNFASLRAEDLIRPDPSRRLQRIVLASNR